MLKILGAIALTIITDSASNSKATNGLQRRLLGENNDYGDQYKPYNHDYDYSKNDNDRKQGWNTGYHEPYHHIPDNDRDYSDDDNNYNRAWGNDYGREIERYYPKNGYNDMDEYNHIYRPYKSNSGGYQSKPSYIKEAIVILNVGDDSNVDGYVKFEDIDHGKKTKISAKITGLSPGKHGWHIHQLGDLFTDGCSSAGPHYNPFNNKHGAPDDEIRHIGDLGNIYADKNGVAYIECQYDEIIKLNGPNSIIGRGFVIHQDQDDLGRGGDDESLQTGNAGSRIRCGIIGIKREE